jgi:anthranilate phosphoribosyltransferase
LARTGIVFLFAQVHHPAMRHVGKVRRQIKMRTIFNLLGPLASPANVKHQLVGIYDRKWLVPYAQALKALGSSTALVVHGADGLDEMTTTAVTFFSRLENGHITEGEITPEQAGLPLAQLSDLKGGTPQENAAALMRLLEGEGPASYRDIVLLNSAGALLVAGKVSDLREGVEMSRDVIRSGKALAKLNSLVAASNR